MGIPLTFTRTVLVDGTPTDADSAPLLTDADATYGVKRIDTGEVVVPAETVAGGIAHGTTDGSYSYTLSDATAGVTYQAAFKFIVGGQTIYVTKTLTASAYLTSRALIESRGLLNTDTWADAESDNNAGEIQAQFDRVVSEAQNEAYAVADEFGLAAIFPPTATEPQYQALVDACTDFAFARLLRINPEPVAKGKQPPGVAEEEAAVDRMRDAFAVIKYRGSGTASAPVADQVTLFPTNRLGCALALCG